jgi:hypothetical protein
LTPAATWWWWRIAKPACRPWHASLAAVDGVYASAALIRMDEPVTASIARGGDLPVFAATGGIWRLLDVEVSPVRSGMVPLSAARRLGLVDGDWI